MVFVSLVVLLWNLSLRRAFAKRQISEYDFAVDTARREAEDLLKSGRNFVTQAARHLKQTRKT